MTLHAFSRRRLLGALLSGPTAWLFTRPFRAAAPRSSSPIAAPLPDQLDSVTTYSYAAGGEPTFTSWYTYDANGNRLHSVSVQVARRFGCGKRNTEIFHKK